uniref:Transcriptional regulator POX01907 n=1 Tax=Penicillium oxalicum TaxID=69781 RepID=A0A3G2KS49_PENOX|nr:transcriptional regulator POX01907 [Penicillium oxalicum]
MDPLRVEGMFTDQVPCAVVGGETGKEVVDEGASFSAVEADPVKLAQIGHAAVRLSWTATANEIYWIATVHLNAIASGSWTANANVIETEIEIGTETETETETVTVTVTVTAIETGTWTDVIRDLLPNRVDNRNSIASVSASSANAIPLPVPTAPERLSEPENVDSSHRKSSIISGPPAAEPPRRESVRPEPAPVRLEPPKDAAVSVQQSPPPSAPQVPAFGSVSTPVPSAGPAKVSSPEGRPSIDATTPSDKDRPPFHPPTGPKAERSQSLHSVESRSHGSESNHRQDDSSRSVRTSVHVPDRSPPTAPAAMVKRDSVSGNVEHASLGRSSVHATSPTFTRLPPPAPRALSRDPSISPRMQTSNIPTGPRAYQRRPSLSPRGGGKGMKAWGRATFGRAPSATGMQLKKDHDDSDERPPVVEAIQQDSPLPAQRTTQESVVANESVQSTPPRSGSVDLPIRVSPPPATKPQTQQHTHTEAEISSAANNQVPGQLEGIHEERREMNAQAAPQVETVEKTETTELDAQEEEEEEEEEEENVVFTKEYLEERKQKFEKDMQSLRAEMPMPPLEDPTIVSLLLKIQMLGKVAHDQRHGQSIGPVLSEEEKEIPSTAPVDDEVPSVVPPGPEDKIDSTSVTIPPKTPMQEERVVDSLPFLHSGPPTPISDMDTSLTDKVTKQHLNEFIRTELIRRQKEVAEKNAALRDEYMSHYKRWRLEVWELDRLKEKKPMTPGPVSPPAPPVPTPPAAVSESREGRRYKGNSELDFLNALKASEISAQEELERRRTRMATARPDLAREAIIPDMLEPRQVKAGIFKDVNNTVDPSDAMEVFGFLPPPNDFTPEEHQLFTDAFMAYPKKWGKIAESLPGRDFRQCIIHYYLTKEEIKYKAKLNKRWSRRGRGKARSSRPKSNALIADLGVVKPDFDGEEEQPPPVTDTGRPRRAAAPTFGDSNDSEGAVAGSRRGQSVKDGELTEKPAVRRGGRATGTRTQRRGAKVVQQDPKSQPSTPQGSNTPVPPAPKIESGIDALVEVALPPEKELVEKEPLPSASRPKAGRGRAKDGIYVFESTETDPTTATPKPSESGYGSLQPTSYWSVPEQRDFPRLLAHFGRDFEGISSFMKTKTTVMVKNYYQRRLDSGQKDFEEIVLVAEEKKARGEPTGPLPVPSVAPKRRYEATPSAIIPRPLAPHGESVSESEDARFAPKSKPAVTSPQTVPVHSRPVVEGDRTSSRYAPLAQASTPGANSPMAATYGDDAARGSRTQPPPSRMSGPRIGFFTEDRRDSPILQSGAQRASDMPISARHVATGAMPQEMTGMEPIALQTYMPGQPSSSLMQTSHSRHNSLTQPPSSPAARPRTELEHPSYHRDPFAPRAYYSLPGQPTGLVNSPRLGMSPVKDGPRPGATPVSEPTPRQVPAKRSNIMSILNDEPEDPQPRKRFASEVSSNSGQGPASGPVSRSVYQPGEKARIDEAAQKPTSYGQPSPYQASSRGYPDYNMSNYGPPANGPGNAVNNDWMARFDPRAQQGGPPTQSQPPPPAPSSQVGRPVSSMATQGSYTQYAGGQSQHAAPPLSSLPAPSPAPTPPPASSQRQSYSSVFSQHGVPSGARDLGPQPSPYRPASPTPRAGSAAYGSRTEPSTAAQSANSPFALAPRQLAQQHSYTSAASPTPVGTPQHSQSYQQHVQTLVNGSHQSHRSTPVALGSGPQQYGHNTLTPQAPGRSMPSLASLGRSYTPPSALHPGSMGFGPPPPPGPSGMSSMHHRASGPGDHIVHPGGHHRVYSQGSTPGGLPSSMRPGSQPPR